jgi:hypothetical protein
MSVSAEYVGFKAKAIVREYSFMVRESSVEPWGILEAQTTGREMLRLES